MHHLQCFPCWVCLGYIIFLQILYFYFPLWPSLVIIIKILKPYFLFVLFFLAVFNFENFLSYDDKQSDFYFLRNLFFL